MSLSHLFLTPVISHLGLPFFNYRVQAGFPSPADDSIVGRLDLNQYLIQNPNATFFMRVGGDAMTGAGIRQHDLLLIDRSIEAKNNSVVIAITEGEFIVRRLKIIGKNIYLIPENKNFNPTKLSENFHIWGVVTSVIHQF